MKQRRRSQSTSVESEHEGGSIDEYNAAKRAYFYENFPLE